MLLLACSNGRGGGDVDLPEEMAGYREVIGRWAGDRIAVVGDYAKDRDFPYEGKVSLLYLLCSTPEELAEMREYWTERAAKEENPEYRDVFLDRLSIRPSDLFNDISPAIRPVLAYTLGVRYTGSGWLDVVEVQ